MNGNTADSREEWTRFAPPPPRLADPYRWHVFLSYRSVNRPWVVNLYDILRDHGYEVFLDQCALTPGESLIAQLEEGLGRSRAGIMVWSQASTNSDWCRREYEVLERFAKEKPEFNFVPLRLDDEPLPIFADLRLFIDFRAYPSGPNGGELLRLLHGIVGQPLSEDAVRFATDQDEASKDASIDIEAAVRNGDKERLVQLFEADGLPWRTSSVLGAWAAEGLLELDATDDALNILDTLEQHFRRAIRPKQLHALALARRGSAGDLKAAQEILGNLVARNEKDPETLGIYGRTWMDRYASSGDLRDLRKSRDCYAEAFEKAEDDYYTGINAAAKSAFLDTEEDVARAAEFAERVQKIVGTEPVVDDYWQTATIGEIFLIQKMYKEAGRLYAAAVTTAHTKEGSHKSTWMQACRLMEKLKPTENERVFVRSAFEHLPECEEMNSN